MSRWIYGTFAIGLFFYQSFDAIDGKQARRTGTSGPLGELFDHGCDALNTTVSFQRWNENDEFRRWKKRDGKGHWTITDEGFVQLEVLLSASALNLGLSRWTGEFRNSISYQLCRQLSQTVTDCSRIVTALVATNANFYLTTWEEFHTGNLFLSAFSGPVEGILLIIAVFSITSVYGQCILQTLGRF